MDNNSTERVSALEGFYTLGHFGNRASSDIIFCELKNLKLFQIAFWPATKSNVENKLLKFLSLGPIPDPNSSIILKSRAVLRVEPLKIWVLGSNIPSFEPEESVTLDLSHSRVHLRISGPETVKLLNSFLPIDLRENSFLRGNVVSTAFHHVGITLWRTKAGYELFLPRGFALSLWELLLESASQFGYDVT